MRQRQRRQGRRNRRDIPTADMPPPGSVEGRQQPQERRPVKTRSSKTKERMAPSLCQPVDQVGGRFSALVDLPGEEKPSSDLSDASEPDEVPQTYDTNHVLAWRDPDLPTPVYVRMDSSGVFYTYPSLGDKPFQSFDEIYSAVVSYACPNGDVMSDEILSEKECAVRERLFWPDGTRKVCTRAQAAKREHDKVQRLVEVLLDKQNDVEDRVDELQEIAHWQSICEGFDKWYYHLNITVKTKGAAGDAGSTSLFFVEVARDLNDIPGYYISTFCRVNTDSQDGEATCLGCINNKSDDMRHPPAAAGSFKGGHMDIRFPVGFGPCNEKQWLDSRNTEAEDEELIKKEEKRIRDCFEYLDDAEFLENMRCKRLNYRFWEYEINLQPLPPSPLLRAVAAVPTPSPPPLFHAVAVPPPRRLRRPRAVAVAPDPGPLANMSSDGWNQTDSFAGYPEDEGEASTNQQGQARRAQSPAPVERLTCDVDMLNHVLIESLDNEVKALEELNDNLRKEKDQLIDENGDYYLKIERMTTQKSDLLKDIAQYQKDVQILKDNRAELRTQRAHFKLEGESNRSKLREISKILRRGI